MSHSDEDDPELFRREMRGVRPLGERNRLEPPPVARPRPRRRSADDEVLAESLTMSAFEHGLETGEELLYRRDEVAPRVLRRLRRGDYSVGAEIDLHGMSAATAHEALTAFVADCARNRVSCARVVHGKGRGSGPRGPVLKHEVNAWLRRWDSVLAFASTPPNDGGTGAVYVLIRARR